jgi:ectoine hydroxylase-related dioxygenase (phytanoyl-CoA dioxygenase family)
MDELAADFRRKGACVVRGLLDAGEVERLSAAVDAHMADPGPMAIEGGGDGSSGRFFEDFRNWDRIRGYEEVIRGSRLGEVAAKLMGSRSVRLHHDHLLVKEPGTTIRTPWHQDQPYYNIDGSDTVSFWIPLDPVPRESTLEFVAGSHASGTWYMPRSFFDDRALVFD